MRGTTFLKYLLIQYTELQWVHLIWLWDCDEDRSFKYHFIPGFSPKQCISSIQSQVCSTSSLRYVTTKCIAQSFHICYCDFKVPRITDSYFSCRMNPAIFYSNNLVDCALQNALQWRHNGLDSVSNHQPRDCLLNRLFRRRSKKTSKLRVTSPHKWPVTRKMFPFDDVIMYQSSCLATINDHGAYWGTSHWSVEDSAKFKILQFRPGTLVPKEKTYAN